MISIQNKFIYFFIFLTDYVRATIPSFSEQSIKNVISIIIGELKYKNAHKNPTQKTKGRKHVQDKGQHEETSNAREITPEGLNTSKLEAMTRECTPQEIHIKHEPNKQTDNHEDNDTSPYEDISESVEGKPTGHVEGDSGALDGADTAVMSENGAQNAVGYAMIEA